MSNREAISTEGWVLVNQILDGTATEAGIQQLDALLRGNAPAQKAFVDYCQLHVHLHAELRVQRVIDSFRQETQDSPRSTKTATVANRLKSAPSVLFPSQSLESHLLGRQQSSLAAFVGSRSLRLSMALAVLLLGAFGLGWLVKSGVSKSNSNADIAHEDQETAVMPVAYLTSANGCAWGGGPAQVRTVGSGVHLGDELTLHEGIAEFRLSSGVSLSIEGPAALIMTSPTSLVLQHGKVTTYVPWAITDFKLIAGACRITACDAELGVRVAGDEIDIHAFSGPILVAPAFEGDLVGDFVERPIIEQEVDLANGSELSGVVVSAGRGLALANRGDITRVSQWHQANKSEFATKLTMAGLLPITKSYVDAILASKPVDYWRFEECKGGLILNEIPGATALKVTGDFRLDGVSTNHAAELGRPGSKCFIISDKALELTGSEYSVELWIKPSHVQNGSIMCWLADLAPSRNERAAFYLQTVASNQNNPARHRQSVRFLHRDPPGPDPAIGTNCYSRSPYTIRRWQHVVAVKSNAEIRLYIDGVLSDSLPDKSSLAANLHLVLGQLGVVRPANFFVGQLDEVAIYDRVLSSDEIDQHIKSLNWKPVGKSVVSQNDI